MPRTPHSTLRACVFDLDGTLVDSYDAIADALSRARALRGLPALRADAVRYDVGHGLESLIEAHLGAAFVEQGVAAFRARYREIFLEQTRALAHVPAVLAELAGMGVALGVASNKPAMFIVPILEAIGAGPFVRVARGPGPDTPPKPDPAMLAAVLDELGVRPDEAAYVGDMPLDAETASRAGCLAVLVPGGSARREALAAVSGATLLTSLADLPSLVRGRLPTAHRS